MAERFANGVIDNAQGRRFELEEAGALAWADYRLQGERLVVPLVEAEPSLRGSGAAGRLMEGVLDAARQRGLKIVPLCAYADAYMRRHPEHGDLRG